MDAEKQCNFIHGSGPLFNSQKWLIPQNPKYKSFNQLDLKKIFLVYKINQEFEINSSER